MTSTRKLLLGSAAATIVVTAGGAMSAQAADAMIKKAPPIQYVRICDMYGNGFWQIPGTTSCLDIRGSIQLDFAFQPTQDLLIVKRSGGDGSYGASSRQFETASQQNIWGYEINVKPKFDFRNETSWGTFRAFVELKGAIDAGSFNEPGQFGPAPGPSNSAEYNTFSIYRAYTQWAGFTLGEADSIFSTGGFKDGDLQNVITGEKLSGFAFNYTWTPSGPGQPPKKGGAPVPDGWSFTAGIESPVKTRSKAFFGTTYNDLQITAGGPGCVAGTCTVGTMTDGPLSWPDVVARVHYEADPPGKDPQSNDQFGIGTFHLVGALHQINVITTGPNLGPSLFPSPGVCLVAGGGPACTSQQGVKMHDTGWAVGADLKVFTPMWGGGKLGAASAGDADSLWFEATYGKGALNYVGVGGQNGNLQSGDAYWNAGLARDDTDARFFNNGAGGFTADKEKAGAFNVQYHHYMTDCTDPVNCWRFNIAYNFAFVQPGDITKNVDWTLGGLGNANKQAITANVIWGNNYFNKAKPTLGELSFEVQYNQVRQDLPSNCNGVGGCGVAATPLTIVSKDTNNWVGRLTATRSW
jgi:hypothetical protein